jgi:hypothetical protein
MSNVLRFPPKGITVTKMDCECGYPLEFWMGDDDCAYGMCGRCNLEHLDQVTVPSDDIQDWTH